MINNDAYSSICFTKNDISDMKFNNLHDFNNLSFKLALAAAFMMILAVSSHRAGFFTFQLALMGLAAGSLIALAAMGFGLIEMFRARKDKKAQTAPTAAGTTLGFLVIMPVLITILSSIGTPMIHDIATDLEHPPEFIAIKALRSATDNPLDRSQSVTLTAIQKQSYPDIESLLIDRPFDVVFEQIVELVKKRGWEVVVISAANGRIEATDTTPIMGFKDDVVIRVNREANRTRVDMRSVSRVGKGDLGTNAARIRSFLNDLISD